MKPQTAGPTAKGLAADDADDVGGWNPCAAKIRQIKGVRSPDVAVCLAFFDCREYLRVPIVSQHCLITSMNKPGKTSLMFLILTQLFLLGCYRTTPLSGVWQSQDGGSPLTFEFHNNGSVRVDLVNNVLIPPVTTTVNGHYKVIDTNHLFLAIELTSTTMIVTQEYTLSGGALVLQAYGRNAWGLGGNTNLKERTFWRFPEP